MSLVLMGANYKTAPIETRERAAGATGSTPDALRQLVASDDIKEAAMLSTCNRVEIYLDAKTDRLGTEVLQEFFQERLGERFNPAEFYIRRGIEAIRHVFRVVCSLDSQVLGEAQIIGQVRTAYETAVEAGTCGEILTKLFKSSLSLGKRVHTETTIGSDSVSLSTTAFRAARDNVEDISRSRVVLLGSGDMAQLISKYLVEAGVDDLTVISRTIEHAREFTSEISGGYAPFETRYQQIARADVVFSMVSSDTPVVLADELQRARTEIGRGHSPLVIVDEGVPRNIDPACEDLPNLTLFDQEKLTNIIDDGLAERLKSVGYVEHMAREAEEEFLGWMQERLVIPTVKEIYEKGDFIVERELKRYCKSYRASTGHDVPEEEREALLAYGSSIMKKVLHGPVARLKKEAQTADSYYYTGAARYLFGLEVFPPGSEHTCNHECRTNDPCPNGYKGMSGSECGNKGK